MAVNIIYMIRNHHIVCACVSGVILYPYYYVFNDLHYVMIMFVLVSLPDFPANLPKFSANPTGFPANTPILARIFYVIPDPTVHTPEGEPSYLKNGHKFYHGTEI